MVAVLTSAPKTRSKYIRLRPSVYEILTHHPRLVMVERMMVYLSLKLISRALKVWYHAGLIIVKHVAWAVTSAQCVKMDSSVVEANAWIHVATAISKQMECALNAILCVQPVQRLQTNVSLALPLGKFSRSQSFSQSKICALQTAHQAHMKNLRVCARAAAILAILAVAHLTTAQVASTPRLLWEICTSTKVSVAKTAHGWLRATLRCIHATRCKFQRFFHYRTGL